MTYQSKELEAFAKAAAEEDVYWVEKAKLDFAFDLDVQRRRSGLSFKQVADKLRTSAAYISKVFRGDTNLTIESMVKLARANGGELQIRVTPKAVAVNQWVTMPKLRLVKGAPSALVTSSGEASVNLSGMKQTRVGVQDRQAA